MADQSSREERIFIAALQLATREERTAYLKNTCAGDAALLQRVEALLQAHDQTGKSLDPDVTVKSSPLPDLPLVEPITEKPGDRIGRYKLLQEIGEGGCGVVYMAEQEEPVRRRVALKVIKLGMDTKQVIARFEAERQALALMDHPNIAKVLDAGATDTGRPFFVMELVRGVPITEYCDQNNLSTHQRLDLFIPVCKAIQHAHQKGIIHRDIKPNNILVTLHDGVPVPKVIDFGIAKATSGQRLTDKTLFTAFAQFVGTPVYMSPEQAEMSGLDIDTRTDIYALGVLLYELLSGKTPFDAKRLHEAGFDEIRRIIRQEEPLRPSTRLSTLDAAEQTTIAKQRQSEPPKLLGTIRGDLDWIAMKCLEKDRTRRYETANGLSMDIQRYLTSEPVVARPPSNLYRFQKLVRRNKLAFVAASAVAAALVIGLGVSTWMFFNEKQARQRAVAAEQAQTKLLQGTIKLYRLSSSGSQLWMQRKWSESETAYREELAAERELYGNENPRVTQSLSNLARVLGEQRKWAEAETVQREGLAMCRKMLANDHPLVLGSLNYLAYILRNEGKAGEAETVQREALAMQRKLLGNERRDIVESLRSLADVLRDQGKLAEAEASYLEAVAIRRKLPGSERPDIAVALHNLADVLRREGKLAEAETVQGEALAMTKIGYADMLRNQGNWAEAETVQREALAMQRKLNNNEHPDVLDSLGSLALLVRRQGRLGEAETIFGEKLQAARSATNSAQIGNALASLTLTLLYDNKFSEAESPARELLASNEKTQPGQWHNFTAQGFLGEALLGQKKYAEAEPLLLSAYEGMNRLYRERKDDVTGPPRLKEALEGLTKLYEALGKPEQAAEWKRKWEDLSLPSSYSNSVAFIPK